MNDINRLFLKKATIHIHQSNKIQLNFHHCDLSSSILESFFINLYFAGDVRLKKICFETTLESRLIVLNNRN